MTVVTYIECDRCKAHGTPGPVFRGTMGQAQGLPAGWTTVSVTQWPTIEVTADEYHLCDRCTQRHHNWMHASEIVAGATMRVPRFSSLDEEREWFEAHAEEVEGTELPENPFANRQAER